MVIKFPFNSSGGKTKNIKSGSNTHFLVNADCNDALRKINDNSIDLIFTDPPYNVGLDYGKYYNDRKKWNDFYAENKLWLAECARVLNKKGSFYLMSYPEISARLLPFIEDELKLKFRRWITWHYPTNIGHSKRNFTRSQRTILFFTKSDDYTFNRGKAVQPYKNPTVAKIKERMKKGSKGRTAYDLLTVADLADMNKGMDDAIEINLLKNVSKDRFNKKHPCQLPLSLVKLFTQVSSNKGDTVLDPFAGTFTLSAVAKELKRNSIGIEINPSYIKLGIKRLNYE